MNLQTKIPLQPEKHNQIDYDSKILLLGSCFVENIGSKFNYYKFQNQRNPFGILFNPIAIERLIINAIQHKVYSDEDVFCHNERWHCFDAHSDLSAVSKESLIDNLNTASQETLKRVSQATHIVITLGTAWVYTFLKTDEIVASCHKIPQKQFKKELLTLNAVCKSLNNIVDTIHSVNENVSIIFTVSPVRHLKDGFVENQRSKSHLISAIHDLLSEASIANKLHYFPSYEIMMDELRDYRFYEEDMIHPNRTAINYIWEKVKQNWISDKAFETMKEVAFIQKGLNHRPIHAKNPEYIAFLENLKLREIALTKRVKHIKFV